MRKGGILTIVVMSLVVFLFTLLLVVPSVFSAEDGFTTICYDEKHSIINHEMICEITNDQGTVSNREVKIDLSLEKKSLRSVEFFEYIEKTRQDPTYEEVCDSYDEVFENGTVQYDNCANVQNGTKMVSYTDVEKLDINSDSKRVKWTAGEKEFNVGETRKFLVKWKTGVNSKGNWKINPEGWWNFSWEKNKAINLSVTGNPTNDDFQALINITYDPDMNPDFSDLRFTNVAGDTELPYYIESKTDSTSAAVWVRILTNVTTTNQTLAYMYYKNTTVVSSLSNNYTTFNLFDDFDATNSTKWSAIEGSQAVSGGEMVVDDDWIYSREKFGQGVIFEVQLSGGTLADDMRMLTPRNVQVVAADDDAFIAGIDCNQHEFVTWNGGSSTQNCVASGTTYTTSDLIGIVWPNSSWGGLYRNNALVVTRIATIPDEPLNMTMRDHATGSIEIDWARVRGWNDTIVEVSFGVEKSGDENFTITFNLTDSVSGEQIDTSKPQDSFDISCDNSYVKLGVENPHITNNTFSGFVECTISGLTSNSGTLTYRNKNVAITADSNKTVEVPMSLIGGLTEEEHDWLEAVYNCLINGVGCA